VDPEPVPRRQHGTTEGQIYSGDWNIKCCAFSGQETYPVLGCDFSSWLRSFESAIRTDKSYHPDRAWNDEQRYNTLAQKLSGSAATFFNHSEDRWIADATHRGSTFGYSELVAELTKQYASRLSDDKVMAMLASPKAEKSSWIDHVNFFLHVQGQCNIPSRMLVSYFVQYACSEETSNLRVCLASDDWGDTHMLIKCADHLNRALGSGFGYQPRRHGRANLGSNNSLATTSVAAEVAAAMAVVAVVMKPMPAAPPQPKSGVTSANVPVTLKRSAGRSKGSRSRRRRQMPLRHSLMIRLQSQQRRLQAKPTSRKP